MKHCGRFVLALALYFFGCNGAFALSVHNKTSTVERPNVILISIDTCRADRLSCYGYDRRTTPNIDAMAGEGVLFRNAIAPTSVTLPSHSSMMTGTQPPFHGVHDNQTYRLGDSNVTLAEILRENGYDTGAVVGTFVLDPKFGLAQGFETYNATMVSSKTKAKMLNDRRADEVNRVAKKWLSQRTERPFFLFLHYYDPHFPYQPPSPYSAAFADDAYAGEIAYVDHCIGEIRSELIRTGIYDSTMIVITSDHGEGLGEHGEPTHGWFIYGSTTHVPLVIKPPGRNKPRVVDDMVALIDLAPTILTQLGIDVPEDMQGRDLDTYLSGNKSNRSERFVYSESLFPTQYGCSSLLSLQSNRWKYIQSSKPELYDLIDDPGEVHNVLSLHTKTGWSMRNRLKHLLADRTRTNLEGAIQASDLATIERLEGLGYVGGGEQIDYHFETNKEDPKDFFPIYAKLIHANHLLLSNPEGLTRASAPTGEFEQTSRSALAKRICKQILAERHDVAKTHEILGRLARREGNLEEAAAHYGHLIRINPRYAAAMIDLGRVRKAQGRVDAAESLYRKAIDVLTSEDEDDASIDKALDRFRAIDPILRAARRTLAELLLKQNRVSESAEQFREVIRIDPIDAKAYTVIALDLSKRDQKAGALEEIQKALEINPDYEPAHRLRARLESSSSESLQH